MQENHPIYKKILKYPGLFCVECETASPIIKFCGRVGFSIRLLNIARCGSGARPPLSLSRRTPPQTTPLHENVEGKRGGRKVRDATPLGDFGLPQEPDHPFEQDNEI